MEVSDFLLKRRPPNKRRWSVDVKIARKRRYLAKQKLQKTKPALSLSSNAGFQ